MIMAMNDSDIAKYSEIIARDFPDLQITSMKHIGVGWHHDALDVNNGIVFRMPREVHLKDLAARATCEINILHGLQNSLPVAIPDPSYIPPDKSYFGYRKLEGTVLADIESQLTDADWLQIIGEWTDLAAAIHRGFSIETARELGVPDFDGTDMGMAEKLFSLPEVETDLLMFAKQTIERVRSIDLRNQLLVLIHNDMQFQNILVDTNTKRMTSLIDWTDVCIGPIAREFAIGSWMHNGRLQAAATVYMEKTGVPVNIEEVILWRSIEEISDYVEETLAGELDEATQTLARIQHLITLTT